MAAEALEQSVLEAKDKDQLQAIAQAIGIKTNARAAKATLIAKILETTGAGPAAAPDLPLDAPSAAAAPGAAGGPARPLLLRLPRTGAVLARRPPPAGAAPPIEAACARASPTGATVT